MNYRARGSTSISASVDFNLPISRKKDVLKLEFGKARGADDEGAVMYTVREMSHEDGPALRLEAVDMNDTRIQKVLALLAEPLKRSDCITKMREWYPEMTPARAAKAVDNDLRHLRALGKVEQISFGVWRKNDVGV